MVVAGGRGDGLKVDGGGWWWMCGGCAVDGRVRQEEGDGLAGLGVEWEWEC